jgi:hypothetical protein
MVSAKASDIRPTTPKPIDRRGFGRSDDARNTIGWLIDFLRAID